MKIWKFCSLYLVVVGCKQKDKFNRGGGNNNRMSLEHIVSATLKNCDETGEL